MSPGRASRTLLPLSDQTPSGGAEVERVKHRITGHLVTHGAQIVPGEEPYRRGSSGLSATNREHRDPWILR